MTKPDPAAEAPVIRAGELVGEFGPGQPEATGVAPERIRLRPRRDGPGWIEADAAEPAVEYVLATHADEAARLLRHAVAEWYLRGELSVGRIEAWLSARDARKAR